MLLLLRWQSPVVVIPEDTGTAAADTFDTRKRRSHTATVKVYLLERDLTVVDELPSVLAGSVSIDRGSPVRRTGQVTLKRRSDLIPEAPETLFDWGRLIRVDRGISVDGAMEWRTILVGTLYDPRVDTQGTWSVQLSDRVAIAGEARLTASVTFPALTRLDVVVRTLAELAGMGTEDALFDLQDGGAMLPMEHTYLRRNEPVQVWSQLAVDHALDIYASRDGLLTMRPVVDPSEVDPVDSYTVSRILELEHFWRLTARNSITVEGDGEEPVEATATVTDVTNPAHEDRIGPRPEWYRSSGIATEAQAQVVADSMLPTLALVEEEVEFQVPPDPERDGGDVVELSEEDTFVEGRFVLDSLTIPFDNVPMRARTRRVRRLGS